jgi:hypothetical protein
MRILRLAGIPVVLLLLSAPPASAQVFWGAHLAKANTSFGGTKGAGLRAGLTLPLIPVEVVGSGEYFFPDCPPGFGGCALKGAALDANLRLPFPVLQPYATGGKVWRAFTPGAGAAETRLSGNSMGAGLNLSLGKARLFGEARYEFVDVPESQVMFRVGLQMRSP